MHVLIQSNRLKNIMWTFCWFTSWRCHQKISQEFSSFLHLLQYARAYPLTHITSPVLVNNHAGYAQLGVHEFRAVVRFIFTFLYPWLCFVYLVCDSVISIQCSALVFSYSWYLCWNKGPGQWNFTTVSRRLYWERWHI